MTENTQSNQETLASEATTTDQYLTRDLKNSIFIVSIIANMIIFIAWVILQVTTQYDSQLANFIFQR